eukprot:1380972-Rhodomonas_salina.1
MPSKSRGFQITRVPKTRRAGILLSQRTTLLLSAKACLLHLRVCQQRLPQAVLGTESVIITVPHPQAVVIHPGRAPSVQTVAHINAVQTPQGAVQDAFLTLALGEPPKRDRGSITLLSRSPCDAKRDQKAPFTLIYQHWHVVQNGIMLLQYLIDQKAILFSSPGTRFSRKHSFSLRRVSGPPALLHKHVSVKRTYNAAGSRFLARYG